MDEHGIEKLSRTVPQVNFDRVEALNLQKRALRGGKE
jgi:hypothetical protein